MIKVLSSLLALLAVTVGCGPSSSSPGTAPDPRAQFVLVIYNRAAPESEEIAKLYADARGVPKRNLLAVETTTNDDISPQDFKSKLCDPVYDYIQKNKLKVDFLLLCRGVPIRIGVNEGYSVDATLMLDAHPKWHAKPLEPMKMKLEEEDLKRCLNPYYNSNDPFDSDKFGMYLATRLDGYSKEDAMALISRSIRAANAKGEFILDASPNAASGGYAQIQKTLVSAADVLNRKSFDVVFDDTTKFLGGFINVMGYAGWGSNDANFDQKLYNSIKFRPGGISETFVSTSARTFRRTTGGQSLIADLIEQGATGVKGYVSEPYTLALAHIDILFDRYTSGRNLAESFYAASPLLKWKDVVIGDPLCAPYAKK